MIQVDKLKDRGEKMEEMVNKFRDASDCIFFLHFKGQKRFFLKHGDFYKYAIT